MSFVSEILGKLNPLNWFAEVELSYDEKETIEAIEREAYLSKAKYLAKRRGERRAEKKFGR